MNVLKYSSVVLFACSISGCMVETTNDPGASEVPDVSEVANAPGAPATADVPVVLSESSAALSIAASPGAQANAGVHHWEIELTKPVARVRRQCQSARGSALRPSTRQAGHGDGASHGGVDAARCGRSSHRWVLRQEPAAVCGAVARRDRRERDEHRPGGRRHCRKIKLRAPNVMASSCIVATFEFGDTGLWECNVHELCGVCFGWRW